MIKKILVALDDVGIASDLFSQALELAIAIKARLILLHVLPPEVVELPFQSGFAASAPKSVWVGEFDSFPNLREEILMGERRRWNSYNSGFLKQLRNFATLANAAGIQAEFIQQPGTPGPVICDFSETWEADLILIGHRGRSGLSELLLGSVSNYVMHHASCSVLVARSQTKMPLQESLEPEQKVSAQL